MKRKQQFVSGQTTVLGSLDLWGGLGLSRPLEIFLVPSRLVRHPLEAKVSFFLSLMDTFLSLSFLKQHFK